MPPPDAAPGGDPLADWPGFQSPRYTQVPNDFFDRLLAPGVLSLAALRPLLYIFRHTFGYGKDVDAIALSQFTEGIVRADGTRVDYGCGLGRAAVMRGLQELEAKGIITVRRAPSRQHGNETNLYSLRWAGVSQGTRSDPTVDSHGAYPRIAAPAPVDSHGVPQNETQKITIQEDTQPYVTDADRLTAKRAGLAIEEYLALKRRQG